MITLDDCERFDLRELLRLVERHPDPAGATLNARHARVGIQIHRAHRELALGSQKLKLTATPQRFGGCRLWVHCEDCSRRVAVLYCLPWSDRYRCRRCVGLPYATAAADPIERARLRLVRLRRRLSGCDARGSGSRKATTPCWDDLRLAERGYAGAIRSKFNKLRRAVQVS